MDSVQRLVGILEIISVLWLRCPGLLIVCVSKISMLLLLCTILNLVWEIIKSCKPCSSYTYITPVWATMVSTLGYGVH